jgi:cyclopropane fatty-acyl-phospholipid synthase-like methyltransferase
LPEWVFADLEIKKDAQVLDVGCGGGANVARMLEMCPEGIVTGMDYSTLAL